MLFENYIGVIVGVVEMIVDIDVDIAKHRCFAPKCEATAPVSLVHTRKNSGKNFNICANFRRPMTHTTFEIDNFHYVRKGFTYEYALNSRENDSVKHNHSGDSLPTISSAKHCRSCKVAEILLNAG